MAQLFGDKVINGTWTEVWLDDEYVAEATGVTAKVEFQTETVNFAGQMFEDRKVVGYTGSGSLTLHKVNTRFQNSIAETMKTGKEARFTLIVKIADPSVDGVERVALKNVCLNSLPLFETDMKKLLNVTYDFSFSDFEYLETIN